MLEGQDTFLLSVPSCLFYFLALFFIFVVKALIALYALLHHFRLRAYLIIYLFSLSHCTSLLLPDASAWSWHISSALAPLASRPVWFILMINTYSCLLHVDLLHLWLMSCCCRWSIDNPPIICTSQKWFIPKTNLYITRTATPAITKIALCSS